MLKGSCACGNIAYEISGELILPLTYCHCWRCRKHSGSSFGTTVRIKANDLYFVEGQDLLSSWASSPGVQRYFASCCGSPIYKSDQSSPDLFSLRLGTLDTDPKLLVTQHYMIDSKAPWVEVSDELEKIEGGDDPFGK